MSPTQPIAQQQINALLSDVDKPARYTGGELNSIVKGDIRCRMALCFADVYEVAESHIGLKILYEVINRTDDFAAERVYAQWPDLEAKARAAGVPLWSLETHRPLAGFDVIGFTLQYELAYATILAMLEQGGVALRSAARTDAAPLVIGGGAGAFNPEPIAVFFDAFVLGDGETAVLTIMETIALGRERGASRTQLLHALGELDGVYVPSHYEVEHRGSGSGCSDITAINAAPGTPKAGARSKHGTPRITRTTIADLDAAPYPTARIVPNVKPVHNRVAIEIQRGCSQACRFCQAGMITRPTRQRSPETVLALAEDSLIATGCNEVSLLSLSAGDYGPINAVIESLFVRFGDEKINVSLPSMRTETMTPELAARVAAVRKSGFTLAPEAGTERMRSVINKTNSDADLISAVCATARAGWRKVKLYFMIGLPTETDADVDAIADLALRARDAGREVWRELNVTVSISTFVPKPHTPFQWERQIGIDETRQKQRRLAELLRPHKIAMRYHSPEQSFLEGVFARGDRRLADVLEAAVADGRRLDAWTELFDFAAWKRLLDEHLAPHGLTPEDYLAARDPDALLAWDHLDAGILKKYLQRQRCHAVDCSVGPGETGSPIDDCALTNHCYACGGCDIADPYSTRSGSPRLRPRLFERGESLATTPSPNPNPNRPAPRDIDDTSRTRLRFRYAKRGRALHISHLDVMDHLLRAVRQSRMPVVYSQGFTPRPRVAFSPACPTGITSDAEYFDVTCYGEAGRDQIDGEPFAAALARLLPDGLKILGVEVVSLKGGGARALNSIIQAISYEVTWPDGISCEALRASVDRFNRARQLWVRVRRKGDDRLLDARQQIIAAAARDAVLQLTIVFANGVSLKVWEGMIAIMGAELAARASIHKTHLTLDTELSTRSDPGGEASSAEANLEVDLIANADAEILDLTALGQRLGRRSRPSRTKKAREDAGGLKSGPYAE